MVTDKGLRALAAAGPGSMSQHGPIIAKGEIIDLATTANFIFLAGWPTWAELREEEARVWNIVVDLFQYFW